jgi:malonyl CoA-acyl carrier protein transacylase
MKRAALILPGRGSYTERSLGSLSPTDELVEAAERLRKEYGLEPLTGPGGLDSAERFEPARHLRPANVSALIYVVSMVDAREACSKHDVVCALGNSMGWYTALAASGALSFEDGFRLVQEMALLQEDGDPGGQVIYPLVDEDWQGVVEQLVSVQAFQDARDGETFPSIDLGGYAVLAGTPAGVSRMLKGLPQVTLGKTTYPFRLAKHGPYHTELATAVSERAQAALSGLEFRAPQVTLIDGRGVRFTPWSADISALRAYTLREQVTTPYDFTQSVVVALREYAPEVLVLPGPGNTLGGVCGQILVAEGWRKIRSRADFDTVQKGPAALLESMRLGR